MVDQDFGRQNNSMSRPPLDSAPLGTNITNRTMSLIESITFVTKTPEPTSLDLTTVLSGDPYLDPSLSDLSKIYNS